MVMLGAQLDDLDGLAQRLRATGGDIEGARGDAQRTTSTVVDAVQTSSAQARSMIEQVIAELLASVAASADTANGAQWTGHNQTTFLGHHAEFQGAMERAGTATNEAFAQFGQAIDQMADVLVEYEASLALALADAVQASTSMAGAVDAQRANLDQVMNTGMG